MSGTVFLSLDSNLDAEAFIEERENEEFADLPNFIQRLKLTIDVAGLSVSTDYFLAHGQITIGEQELSLNSLINRDSNGKTVVVYRTLGQT